MSTNCNHSALGSYILSSPVFVTNVAKSVVKIHSSSRELCWCVDSKADFCFQYFPYSRQSNTETHLKIGHDHFYPHPFNLRINVYTHTATAVAKVHFYEPSSGSTIAGHVRQKLGHLLSLLNTIDRWVTVLMSSFPQFRGFLESLQLSNFLQFMW